MLKSNYDDLSSIKEENQKSKRKLSPAVIAVISLLTLIIIAVAVLIIYNVLSKVDPAAGTNTVAASAPAADAGETISLEPPSVPESASTSVPVPEPATATPSTANPDFSQTTTAQSLSSAAAVDYEDAVQYQDYTMQNGDTLDSVAQKFGVTLQTILSINQIKNPSAIVTGTTISIPDRSGRLYTVEEGDMLSSITRKFGLSMGWKTLQEVNGLKAEKIYVGQTLFIPDETAVQSISFAAGGIAFKNPLSGGTTIGYYGQSRVDPVSKSNIILDGLLISASEGAVVKAAASGTVMDVAFDSRGNKGFFIKIAHDGGYNSYYYYLDSESIKVSVSDKVDIGDSLGTLSSASSPYNSPTLFFQIEQNTIMLDPSVFFGN